MKLFKSLLIISAISAGSIATANHPLINELKGTVIENVSFFKQTNHSLLDIHNLLISTQKIKELTHQLSLTRITRKELTLLVTVEEYLKSLKPLFAIIDSYQSNQNCQLNLPAQISNWIKANQKQIDNHVNALDLLNTQWSTLAL